jgi:hypothetical protein
MRLNGSGPAVASSIIVVRQIASDGAPLYGGPERKACLGIGMSAGI